VVEKAGRAALRAAWCQKWAEHRRLKPKEFDGRVHNHKAGLTAFPIDGKLLSSPILDAPYQRFGSVLLANGLC
jgi:hypothetical protein